MRIRYAAANGPYTVKLLFIESYAAITGPNQRVFDVKVEDVVIPGLDIFAKAGGREKPWTESVDVEVKDDAMDIEFIKKVEYPKINAVAIVPRF
jgi:hypothetical protein